MERDDIWVSLKIPNNGKEANKYGNIFDYFAFYHTDSAIYTADKRKYEIYSLEKQLFFVYERKRW